MDISKNWEKVVLLLASVVALFVAITTIMSARNYVDKFEIQVVAPNDELPVMEKETVVTSKKLVEIKSVWAPREIAPANGGKVRPVPLFKSITIVEIKGELIDMSDPNANKVRPPVSNKWLLDNELDFLNSNVLTRDPDSDGFTTLEEWNAKTSPRDPASHPPFADKLKLIARKQQNYILEFAAKPDEERFQIIRHPSRQHKRGTFIMRKGETSPDNLFRIDKYEKKEAVSKLGIRVDASVLTITYLPDERSVELVRRVKEVIPTYYGQFILTIGSNPEEFYVKRGDAFRLPIDPETEYKLIDIGEEKAVISFQSEPGKEVEVEIRSGK